MAVMPLPPLYVALGGSGMTPDKTAEAIDLSKYFKDDETPSLTYKVKSVVPPDVATVEIKDGKTVTVGKKVGTATVTIEVYDSVNDPIEGTFSVEVVASNVKPTASALSTGADGDVKKLAAKLYVGRGVSTVTVSSVIYDFGEAEGSAGDNPLSFHPVVGNAGGDDDIISVSVVDGSKPDTWDVMLTPKKAGHQNVEITIKDKFGAAADTTWKFEVLVNNKPSVKISLPDRTVTSGTGDAASTIAIATYFTTVEIDPTQPIAGNGMSATASGPVVAGNSPTGEHPDWIDPAEDPTGATADNPDRRSDVTCSYSTNPDQTIIDTVTPTNDQMGFNVIHIASTVDSTAAPADGDGTLQIPDGKVGQYNLTIACRDAEHTAVSTATITVILGS